MSKKLNAFNFLRAFAAVAVLAFHLMPGTFPGAFLAVNIFFVISGFFIYIHNKENNAGRFYKKRILRIYPALILTIFFTCILYKIFIPLLEIKPLDITASLTGAKNWYEICTNSNYFSRMSNQSPFTHLWTVAIEMQIYLLWPFIAVLLRKLSSKNKKIEMYFLIAIIAILFAWTYYLYDPSIEVSRIYYATDTRIISVFVGFLLGFIYKNYMHKIFQFKPLIHTLSIVGLVAFAFMSLQLSGQDSFSYQYGILLSSIIPCFWILSIVIGQNNFAYVLEKTPISIIGKYSYEVYLVQYPILFAYGYYKFNFGFYAIFTEIMTVAVFAKLIYSLTHLFTYKKGSRVRKKRYAVVIASILVIASFLITDYSQATAKNSRIERVVAKSNYGEIVEAETLESQSQPLEETSNSDTNNTNQSSEPSTEVKTEAPTNSNESVKKTFIGDSVMLGAKAEMENVIENAYIDAKESRQVTQAKTIVSNLKANNELGDIVVIALGTNGTFSKEKGQDLINEIGSDKKIYWLTAYGTHLQTQNEVNYVINSLANDNPNLSIIRWDEHAKNHTEWFYNDGIHLNAQGRKAYAEFLKSSIN